MVKTKVVAFSALPAQTKPFQPVTVKWDVVAEDGVRLDLDGQPVHEFGRLTVNLFDSHTFTLRADGAVIGSQRVEVDTHACGAGSHLELVSQMVTQIKQLVKTVENDPANPYHGHLLSLLSPPAVSVQSGALAFQIHARQATGGSSPDAYIDLDYSITPVVAADGTLTPIYNRSTVDIHPAHSIYWLIPYPPATIEAAIKMGNARTMISHLIQTQITALFGALQHELVPAGMHATFARLTPDQDGTLTVGYCPPPSNVQIRPPVLEALKRA